MSADRERWYRILYWVAAIYDLTLGVVFLFFYRPAFEWLGIEDRLPEYTSFLSLIAAFLFVIGVAYVFVARGDLARNRDLIAVGALYKLAYFSVALWYLVGGVYPHIVFFVVFGIADLAFLVAMTECWWFVRHLEPGDSAT
jgi:hypothetical protein